MQRAGIRSFLLGAVALAVVSVFAGCENPLDPLDKSDKIEGLSYIDFSATWDRWDSDPQYDGVRVDMVYSNEFNEALAFHDKPHNIVIEFWTQVNTGTVTTPFMSKGTLIFSNPVRFSSSDDPIRIPIELYYEKLMAAGIVDPITGIPPIDGVLKGFMVVHVYPPQGYPSSELLVAQPDMVLFKPQDADGSPNP